MIKIILQSIPWTVPAATRGKWRIPDGKVGERFIVMFGAPKVVASPCID
jgi:hypothetical protein